MNNGMEPMPKRSSLRGPLLAALLAVCSTSTTANTTRSAQPTPLPSERFPCAAFTNDATYIDFSIRMELEDKTVPLSIPIQFFEDFWDRRSGYETQAQLFRVEIGSFEPVSRKETSVRTRKGVRNWFRFLIKDHIPLEDIAHMHMKLSGPFEFGQQLTGEYKRLPAKYGLKELDFPDKQPEYRRPENVFVDENSETGIAAVIKCFAPGSFKFPGCQLYFRAAALDVSVNFRRTELPNWQKFQADITQFLTCATSSGA
ncbi:MULTISPECIES: hypothetical protein [Halocynthiibacter]|uniref:DUF3108 domain-containing protein n=1 Tax=Halocynthiibacter halioticoli TaxID=2986804 RepID=A0AAE3IXY2_9RHOB|nr:MULTISPECIES: hypothetical protein [Halocynthiibacter]MCV6824170.1 hypothetical protein [Halocynthiibacter halioticoli]MCW4057171.1 hypothetical protein [Halocynthiibacter sp. SDUM655004]